MSEVPQRGSGRENLAGIGVAPGIAIGRALVLAGPRTPIFRVERTAEEAKQEAVRFRRAICGAWRQLRALRDRVRIEAGDSYARVFDAQILILRDRSLFGETVSLIRTEHVNAEWAFHVVIDRYTQVFRQLGDESLKERGTDIEDVESRVQSILDGGRRVRDLEQLNDETILVAPSLSPSDAAGLNHTRVIGLVIEGGGPTSHTAIIAAALGIPAVSGLPDASRRLTTGDMLALDGAGGVVVRNPDERDLVEWKTRRARLAQRDLDRAALRDLPADTPDGTRIRLMANIELLEETDAARRFGAEGIGLYRSEFIHLHESAAPPDEEAHFQTYRELAERSLPHEVVIRTLDTESEIESNTPPGRAEPNPVLGLRAIRRSLKSQEPFRLQLRGILRAATHGKVRVLLPMVSSVEEVRQARELIRDVARELEAERVPFDPNVPVGIMMEVPGAIIMADRLAREVDFFSVGTNDLIQYTLAVDRTNESVSFLYRPLHPAILRLLRRVTEASERSGIRVSVCGEMAAEPMSAVVLAGLGFRELSMTPSAIPGVKEVLRSVSMREARSIVEEAMSLDTVGEIEVRVRRRVLDLLPAEYACPI
ncbi:MAG: phosphoenolpyruvate--protein phosphotransferase [Acidobacteriota bacterium]